MAVTVELNQAPTAGKRGDLPFLIADFPSRADWGTISRSLGLPAGLWLTFSACNATIAPEPLLLIVVSLSARSGWRRSKWRGLCAVAGLGSTQDCPVVAAGLGVAAFALDRATLPSWWLALPTGLSV